MCAMRGEVKHVLSIPREENLPGLTKGISSSELTEKLRVSKNSGLRAPGVHHVAIESSRMVWIEVSLYSQIFMIWAKKTEKNSSQETNLSDIRNI